MHQLTSIFCFLFCSIRSCNLMGKNLSMRVAPPCPRHLDLLRALSLSSLAGNLFNKRIWICRIYYTLLDYYSCFH